VLRRRFIFFSFGILKGTSNNTFYVFIGKKRLEIINALIGDIRIIGWRKPTLDWLKG
jgi:hypothetical protein